ncbi:MAG: hypothetical protein MMC33_001076 [Icmadophila ericetorum]|nr:hypothetical protein [Icmadophila ericetorum]
MSSHVLQPTDPNTTMNMNPFATTTTITESENEKMGSFGATDMGAENVAVEKGVSKPKSMEFHRQQLKEKLDGDKSDGDKQTYISPSDTILSPCTQKLSALKSKRFAKVQPKSLFAKMSTKPSSLSTAADDSSPEKSNGEVVDGEGMGKDILT